MGQIGIRVETRRPMFAPLPPAKSQQHPRMYPSPPARAKDTFSAQGMLQKLEASLCACDAQTLAQYGT